MFICFAPISPLFSDEPQQRLLPTSFPIPASGLPKTIKIGLLTNVSSSAMRIDGPYEIRDGKGNAIWQGQTGFEGVVQTTIDGFTVNRHPQPVKNLQFISKSDLIQVGKRRYSGSIRIVWHSARTMTVVNEIDIDEYLKGVLPLEVSPAWSMESLKAHAVISRTFAIFKSIEKQNQDFVMPDTVLGQVYGGSLFHKRTTDEAVRSTEGEILTYGGRIIATYFFAACGGQTAQPDQVWPLVPNPALRSVKCDFCHGTRHHKWTFHMPLKELEGIFQKNGYPAKNLRSATLTDHDISGRARKALLRYENSEVAISADSFREWIGYDRLRSLKAEAKVGDNREIYFRGFGWGHGIGFCQWGSKKQAELGRSYQEILYYYFPGSAIWKPGMSAQSGTSKMTEEEEEDNIFTRLANTVASMIGES